MWLVQSCPHSFLWDSPSSVHPSVREASEPPPHRHFSSLSTFPNERKKEQSLYVPCLGAWVPSYSAASWTSEPTGRTRRKWGFIARARRGEEKGKSFSLRGNLSIGVKGQVMPEEMGRSQTQLAQRSPAEGRNWCSRPSPSTCPSFFWKRCFISTSVVYPQSTKNTIDVQETTAHSSL